MTHSQKQGLDSRAWLRRSKVRTMKCDQHRTFCRTCVLRSAARGLRLLRVSREPVQPLLLGVERLPCPRHRLVLRLQVQRGQ